VIHFEIAVEVARARDAVFAYVSEPSRYAEWNSAVQSVVRVGPDRYLMHRVLPSGPAENELEIVARPPTELTLRALSGPTPFVYRYTFSATPAGTLITLRAEVELAVVAALLGPVAAHSVKRGVDANFGALRGVLEAPGETL
jgi:carbon monoxide dehydrogenase subunit G